MRARSWHQEVVISYQPLVPVLPEHVPAPDKCRWFRVRALPVNINLDLTAIRSADVGV